MSGSSRPAAEGIAAGWYPPSPVDVNHTAPVPRRIRAMFDGVVVVDSTRVTYVWEHPYYPQFYVPGADVDRSVLEADGTTEDRDQGTVELLSLVHGDRREPGSVRHLTTSGVSGLDDSYRFDWKAMDAWLEEDEQVFVHPRSPYVRVDALRTGRHIRVEKDGVVLADASMAVAVFETGLPTRWYLDRTAIDWRHLVDSDAQTDCPYKGTTSRYWSVRLGDTVHEDLAWSYDFPSRQLTPIAGLVCFYNDKVDVFLDGEPEIA